MDAGINVRGLRKAFGEVVAVDDLNLTVRRGEIVGLVGPDGAGKTTTMRMLCGIMRPDAGEVLVAGRDVARDPESVKPHLGYLSQRFSLYGDLTVAENIAFFADLFEVPRAELRERRAELLRITRMEPFTDRLAEALSGGMRQKLALMCTLVHRPEVLLLDEPTTGVDPLSRRDFWRLLHGLPAEGVTLLISTPYMDEAARCDRVGFMLRGRLAACDTPAALRKQVAGELFSMVCRPQDEARRLLERHPAVQRVTVFGDRLHVQAAEGTRREELMETVRHGGVEVTSAEPTEPGLEDAFVALAGAEIEHGS